MMLTVGSLFSGIGGLDLGLERAGMEVRWQCEIEAYASRVLAHHWPHVPNLGDVTNIDWQSVECVDLVCGGYPCQPFSLAGSRRGEDDARHLWPYFRDALSVLRPRYALLENVPGHLSLGFDRVLADLADLGFDAEWDCIPAAAVGAPHLRYRIFIFAHAARERDAHKPNGSDASGFAQRAESRAGDRAGSGDLAARVRVDRRGSNVVAETLADADRWRQQERTQSDREPQWRNGSARGDDADGFRDPVADTDLAGPWTRRSESSGWRVAKRLASWWAIEPDVGRVAHGIPARVDRLRCLGNAVVPQVAQWIGEQIVSAEGA